MRQFIAALVLICLVSSPLTSIADSHSPTKGQIAKPKGRPVIGMALAGGGALGFAHFGVFKVLERERIGVDVIAGTSMGSIVGAAYASGRSIADLEKVITDTDWDRLFNESVPRELQNYRMKTGRDGELYGDAKFGLVDGELVVPTAVVEGQQIEPLFQKIFGNVPANCSFDELPIRYRAVAADIETGKSVVLDHGSLALAARASMSVPAFFSPVEIDGRLLVDGGVTNNYPVDVAQELGAEVVIAVEFPTPLRTRDKLTNPLAITAQVLDIMLERTSVESRKFLRPQDIVIQPDLTGYSSTSFKNAKEIIKLGEEAAEKMLPQLQKYKMPENEYHAWNSKRTAGREFAPIIEYVRVEGPENKEQTILDEMNIKVGEKLDRDYVNKHLADIHQTGIYRKVSADVEQKDGKYGLVIRAQEKEWLKNYLRLGLALEDNFDGNSFYSLAVNGRMRELNAAGAWLDGQVEIGRNPRAALEFYQPLSAGSPFFFSPDVNIGRQVLTVRQGGENVAEYDRESLIMALKTGVSFGRYGEFVTGWRRGPGQFERQIGNQELPEFDYDVGEWFSRLVLDQYDNPDFPTKGYRVALEGLASRDSLGGSDDFEQGRFVAGVPLPITDSDTLLINGELGASSGAPDERSFSMGGFFDISGFNKNSLVADNFWIARAMYFHRFSKASSSLVNFGGFIGGTVEYSNLRTDIEAIGDMDSIVSGSAFVGFDTPVFPVYFGLGLSDESERSLYLAIGRVGSRRR